MKSKIINQIATILKSIIDGENEKQIKKSMTKSGLKTLVDIQSAIIVYNDLIHSSSHTAETINENVAKFYSKYTKVIPYGVGWIINHPDYYSYK